MYSIVYFKIQNIIFKFFLLIELRPPTHKNFNFLFPLYNCVSGNSLIKLWFKLNYIQFGTIDKYINSEINNLIKKYSIKIKPIKPEY